MGFRANPHLKRIAKLVGVQDTTRAVEALVKNELNRSPSLEALANNLGVAEIVEENLPFEGGLFTIPEKGLVIKLKAGSLPSRKRFTLAHEIAHLLLGTVPAQRSGYHDDPELERACDTIAAELLMPSEDAIAFIRGLGPPSPDKLKTIATRYAVSLQTAAIRVHADFRLWKCFIGYWERRPQIKTLWFVGRRRWDRVEPDSYSLDLALSSETPVQSEELWQRGPSADPVWLRLLRHDDNRVLGLIGFLN